MPSKGNFPPKTETPWSQGYLHAMTLVQREKEAWSGKGDVMTREGNNSIHRLPLTSERKKMVQVGDAWLLRLETYILCG